MIKFALFGAGRIGKIHAENIARHPGAELRYVIDINRQAAQELAQQWGAEVRDEEKAFSDPDINAVVIASATDTHADLVMAAARAGKAIFCEKPIHSDIEKVKECLAVVEEKGIIMGVGFNRRFDPNFSALKAAIDDGKIGKVEMVTITSRDPGPPPIDYIKVSGGLFLDMTIHDFDMARWLLDEEVIEVYATGSCQVDPAIGQAGDIDTAMIILKTASGKLCQISNSRRASYGYDQRVEVHGEKGMLRAGNMVPTTVEIADEHGTRADNPLHFFLERYAEAYRIEMDDFIRAVKENTTPRAVGLDGLEAQKLAGAALTSLRSGQPVALEVFHESSLVA